MPSWRRLSVAQVLVGGSLVVAAMVTAGALFVLSGLYNVAATRHHWDVTTWLLDLVRKQSIRTHSLAVVDPPPVRADLVRLGAAHYELGCAVCHGAPGRPPSALRTGMLPMPPPLDEVAHEWSPRQLFWIVHSGQKYTGMPSWIAPARSDEVWPVVAFLERLPHLDAAGYRELAGLDKVQPAVAAPQADLEVCARCHGRPGELPPIALVPQLSGQSHDYLLHSLRDYAEGRRPSGYMQLVANMLDGGEMRELSATYAEARAPEEAAGETSGDVVRGRQIAHEGLPATGVPACLACHLTARNPAFPRLQGLSAPYIAQQLRVFKDGHRDATLYGAIMKPIATRLDERDMQAVAAYLAAMPAGTQQ